MTGLTPPGPPAEDPEPTPAGPPDRWQHTPMSDERLRAAPTNAPSSPPSKAMAGWALGLSLAFCVPFGFLVAIGLAIAVLVRSRDGRDHGKGMAVAALVISGILLVLNVGYVVVVVGQVLTGSYDETTRNDDGDVVEPGDISITKLRVGDCFSPPTGEGPPLEGEEQTVSLLVTAMPCDEPHVFEVYSIVRVPTADYPGSDTIRRMRRQCLDGFEGYVGVPPLQSSLSVVDYFPTARSWRFGQRTITCSLTVDGYRQLRHSLRDSKR